MAIKKSTISGLDFKEAIDLIFNIGSKSTRKLPFYYILKLISKVTKDDPKFESIVNNPDFDNISKDILDMLKKSSELPEEIKLTIVRDKDKVPGTIKLYEASKFYHRIKDPTIQKSFWKMHIECQPSRNVLRNIVAMIEKGETLDKALRESSIRITGRPSHASFIGALSDIKSIKIVKKEKYDESLLLDFLKNKGILAENELENIKVGIGDTKFSISGPIRYIDKINESYETIENDFSDYVKQRFG